ncbi:aminopeptidase [Nonomuraea pusilla]|uniref:Aminopeptidase n=1 Tax=Nonomuraea pusilla TaxID=46177 RepID=A0A1H7ZWP7_9ACTN|nr:aminopeptidase [Nonomuraea pusilla]SEM63112.1 aminopeptidase [Nonomuraea pusilla]
MTTVEHRLAELAVGFGVSLRPGQVLAVDAMVGQERLARAVAAVAYEAGARYVDVQYFDPHVRRSRLLAGDDLAFTPGWLTGRVAELAEHGAAAVHLVAAAGPALAEGVDPLRSTLAHDRILPEMMALAQRQAIAWCMVPGPTEEWARALRPAADPGTALAALWDDVAYACRLDEPDPSAAWRERTAELRRVAAAANAGRWDALRFRGPGTDLTVGLFPTSRWAAIGETSAGGGTYHSNLPSEEVYTAPDPRRTSGVATLRRPRLLHDGSRVDELTLRYDAGRLVEVEGSGDVEALRRQFERDPGASRLGEVALVASDGRCGRLAPSGAVLLDENAGCHIAMGAHYPYTVGDADRAHANVSAVHMDLVIGERDVEVDAVTEAGRVVPVLRDGQWVI